MNHPGRVILVEDNPDDEMLTLRAFKKVNIANPIEVARDGQEAVDVILDNDGEVPALVILDLKLPKLSGLEVLERIRAHEKTRLVPVVILTTSDEESDRISGYGLGANSYVRKPVEFDGFADAVAQLGLYWMVINEPPPPGLTNA
jgi:two-component system response regulator